MMMKRFGWILVYGVLLSSSVRAELSKEQKSALHRGRSQVNAVATKLKMSGKYVPSEPGYERILTEAKDKLAKALELLKDVDLKDPEAAPVAAQIEEINAEFAKRNEALAAYKAGAAADTAALEQGVDSDKPTMAALTAKLPELRSATGDVLTNEGLSLWSKLRDDAEALLKKYEGKIAKSEDAKAMIAQCRDLRSALRSAQDNLRNELKELPARIETYLKSAEQGTQGKPENNIDAFAGHMRDIERLRIFFERLEILAKAEPGTDVSALAGWRARAEAVEQKIAAGKVHVVARAQVPTEQYSGGDKDKLRTLIKDRWTEVNPKFPAIKIVLAEREWTRRSEWVWEQNRWVKSDYSSMRAWVFIKADDKTANYYACYLFKDHLNGGRLTIKLDTTNGNPPNLGQVVLLSKL